MKLPIAKLRIPILLPLAVGEIIGLLHFYRQLNFVSFVIFSSEGILFILPLLWLDLIRRHGVRYFDIFVSIGWGFMAIRNSGGVYNALFFVLLAPSIVIAVQVSRNLLRSVNKEQEEAFLMKTKTGDSNFGSVSKYLLGILICILLLNWIWPPNLHTLSYIRWAIILLLPALWITSWHIIHRFIRIRTGGDANGSTESLTDQGGRA